MIYIKTLGCIFKIVLSTFYFLLIQRETHGKKCLLSKLCCSWRVWWLQESKELFRHRKCFTLFTHAVTFRSDSFLLLSYGSCTVNAKIDREHGTIQQVAAKYHLMLLIIKLNRGGQPLSLWPSQQTQRTSVNSLSAPFPLILEKTSLLANKSMLIAH